MISGEKDASMSLIRSESRLIEKYNKDNLLQPHSWSNNEAIELSARNIIAAVKLNLVEEIVFHLNRVNNQGAAYNSNLLYILSTSNPVFDLPKQEEKRLN